MQDDRRIPRPETAIASWRDLKVGDEIWETYGIWPPQMGGKKIIASQPAPFREHREYSDIHKSQGDLIALDLQYPADADVAAGMVVQHFASDRNLDGPGHNNNYVFRSEADALAYIAAATAWWEERPLLIAKAEEEHLRWREWDDHYSYDYDPA